MSLVERIRGFLEVRRGLKEPDSPPINGSRTHYNLIRPRKSLNRQAPAKSTVSYSGCVVVKGG